MSSTCLQYYRLRLVLKDQNLCFFNTFRLPHPVCAFQPQAHSSQLKRKSAKTSHTYIVSPFLSATVYLGLSQMMEYAIHCNSDWAQMQKPEAKQVQLIDLLETQKRQKLTEWWWGRHGLKPGEAFQHMQTNPKSRKQAKSQGNTGKNQKEKTLQKTLGKEY